MKETEKSKSNISVDFDIDPTKIFSKNSLSKIGIVMIVLSTIGLIVSFTVPWAYADFDNSGLKGDEKFFGHDLKNKDDVHLALIPMGGSLFGFAGLSYDITDYTGFIDGTPGMADAGFIFLLLIGVLLVVFSMIKTNEEGFFSKMLSFSTFCIGVFAIIPSLMVFLAGLRFVGINFNTALNAEVLRDAGLKDLVLFFPAAYIVLVFGIIFFFLILSVIKPNIRSIIDLKNGVKADDLVVNVRRFAFIFIFLSVLGLVFMPLFPWVASSDDGKTSYLHEDDVMMNGELADEFENDLDDLKSKYSSYDRYGLSRYYDMDNYWQNEQFDDAEDYLEALVGMSNNLSGIGLFFWLSLIFSIIILVGVELYNFGEKYHLFSHLLFLLGIIVLISAIFVLLNHLWFVGNIGVLSESYKDLYGGQDITFSFNVFPLLAALGLLIVSLVYMLKIFPVSLKQFTDLVNKDLKS